jgi:hypothetical protein
MKKSKWMIRGVVGLLAWLGIGFAVAQAQVIYPVSTTSPFLPNTSSPVTVSILKGGVNVTGTWRPEPGETVQIAVNGVATPSITLAFTAATAGNPIANASLTTSAYPGQCTNFNNPVLAQNAADFQLSGNNLTSTDCGGMAVIQVTAASLATPLTFILPQDSNFNGIPDIWESVFCPGNTCPTGREDADTSPGNPNNGDGIAAFDEYRGFIISGAHVRTDSRQKDLFVHVVNPQCGASTLSLLGGGSTTFVTGDAFFASINTLVAGAQVRRLGHTAGATNFTTNEWVDNFQSYAPLTGIVFTAGTDGAVSDRRINVNQVAGTAVQKGLRITECVDETASTPLGVATLGSPNGGDNAIIFTKRIVNYFATLGATAASTNLCYQTFQSGAWTTAAGITHSELIARAITFYTAMEVGHSIVLTPTSEGTSKTPTLYGYHHAPGTGSNLDQTIINKPGAKCGTLSSANLFQIPTNYNTSDQTNFKFK